MVVYKQTHLKRETHLHCYEFQFMGERRKKCGFPNEFEAERAEMAEKEKILRIKNGEYELDEDFNTYIEDWLNNRRNLGENTKANYSGMLRNHILPYFEEFKVNTVRAINIKNFLDHLYEKDLSSSTVAKNYNIINRMYSELVRMEMLRSNPCGPVEAPSETSGDIQVFETEELREFLRFAEEFTRYAFGFKLAAFTGMRRGELLALRWSDLDLNNKIVNINRRVVKAAYGTDRFIQSGTKTGRGRRIAFPKQLIQDITKHQEIQQIEKGRNDYKDNDLVIATQNGNVVYPDNFTRAFRRTLEESGIDKKLTLHSLRHTHATMLINRGENMKIVSGRLGHSSIRMTMDTYTHFSPTMDSQAMEKLEDLFD